MTILPTPSDVQGSWKMGCFVGTSFLLAMTTEGRPKFRLVIARRAFGPDEATQKSLSLILLHFRGMITRTYGGHT